MLKEIPDFDGYFADENGNIYTTLKKGCRNRFDLSKRISPQKLKYRYLQNGYARVYMRRVSTNKREDVYVHRIIAKLFVENPENKPFVNHLDCNRANNKASNLEWVTSKENNEYALKHGFMQRLNDGTFSHK